MALRKQEPLLRSYGDTLVRSVKSRISTGESVFDAVKLYNFTTFDIMADLAFGQPFHLIENAEYTPWVKLVFGATKAVSIIRILAYFPPLQDVLLALVPKSTRDAKEEYFRFAAELVDRRLANERTAPDIWNLVLTQEATKQMSLEEMHSNAVLFMVPGTDTTATLLSGLTYLLLKHPHYMTRVTEEVRGGFADEEDIKMEALARLPFLNACIEEALRLYPASPGGVPRQAPKGGTVVCGKFVPGGTSMYIPPYVSFRSEKDFAQPNDYRPERWLGVSEFAADNRAAMQPFSTGPRNCIGKNLAYHEIRLLFALVIWNFDLELVNDRNWLDQLVWTAWEKTPLMIRMRPRQ